MGRGQQTETAVAGVTATRRAEAVARAAANVKAAVQGRSAADELKVVIQEMDPNSIGFDVQTYEEIDKAAAQAKCTGTSVVGGTFGLGTARRLRAALGFRPGESAEIQVVFDRSGSIHAKPELNREQILMAEQWEDLERQIEHIGYGGGSRVGVGVSGYDGGWNNATVYEIKPAGGPDNDPYGDHAKLNLAYMSRLGGGGTPTTQGVVHGINTLGKSSAEEKVLVVITDGMANTIDTCALAVAAAREQGIRVIGALQDPEQDYSFMDEQFGPDNWYPINDAEKAPEAFLEHLEKMRGPFVEWESSHGFVA